MAKFIKNTFIIFFIAVSMVYSQNGDTNNESTSNYFNVPTETENNTNNEPAILQDIRNIENGNVYKSDYRIYINFSRNIFSVYVS